GNGTVFKVANDANHTLSTLVAFNGTNGFSSTACLISDTDGNFYGTTNGGGALGYGNVFKMANDANHTLTTLAVFDGTNGRAPTGGVVRDASGNLYGITAAGGQYGDGTVFEVANDADHTLTTLVTFNSVNGQDPLGELAIDSSGNLFGTTEAVTASGHG